MTIVYAVLALGMLGLLLGLLLHYADKKFHVDADPRLAEIRACLGGANCGACGYAGCDAFAQAVADGEAAPEKCAPAGPAGAAKMAAVLGVSAEAKEPVTARVLCQGISGVAKERYRYDGYASCLVASEIAGGPKTCRFACIGMGDCMDRCVFHAISMQDGIAHIDEALCTGCVVCVDVCPRHVIRLFPASQSVMVRCRNTDVARTAREVCMDACIGCGRCKKNCEYDAIIVENGCAHILPEKCVRCGKCAELCPCKCITVA